MGRDGVRPSRRGTTANLDFFGQFRKEFRGKDGGGAAAEINRVGSERKFIARAAPFLAQGRDKFALRLRAALMDMEGAVGADLRAERRVHVEMADHAIQFRQD